MIDVERLRAEVERQYIAATENLSNRRRTVEDFRESHGVRLVKWGAVLQGDRYAAGDEESAAAEVVERIVDFERALLVGEHATRPSSVARCFLKGQEVPAVFPVIRPDVADQHTEEERAQIKVRHIFGVQQ